MNQRQQGLLALASTGGDSLGDVECGTQKTLAGLEFASAEAAIFAGAVGVLASGGPGAGRHIVLGLRRFGLRELADKIGAETLLSDPAWKTTLLEEIANPASNFTVSVEGLSGDSVAGQVLSAVSQGIQPGATPTNWELAQLYQSGRLDDVAFVDRSGANLGNPFK